jgi:predicted metal-dependent phosphoesterase TrpH
MGYRAWRARLKMRAEAAERLRTEALRRRQRDWLGLTGTDLRLHDLQRAQARDRMRLEKRVEQLERRVCSCRVPEPRTLREEGLRRLEEDEQHSSLLVDTISPPSSPAATAPSTSSDTSGGS